MRQETPRSSRWARLGALWRGVEIVVDVVCCPDAARLAGRGGVRPALSPRSRAGGVPAAAGWVVERNTLADNGFGCGYCGVCAMPLGRARQAARSAEAR